MATATMTIRLPEEEKRLISDYAQAFGTTVSELARRSIMERIEDEIDARDLMEAMAEDDGVRYTMDEVMAVMKGSR